MKIKLIAKVTFQRKYEIIEDNEYPATMTKAEIIAKEEELLRNEPFEIIDDTDIVDCSIEAVK